MNIVLSNQQGKFSFLSCRPQRLKIRGIFDLNEISKLIVKVVWRLATLHWNIFVLHKAMAELQHILDFVFSWIITAIF